jgi:hypothetical protein
MELKGDRKYLDFDEVVGKDVRGVLGREELGTT